MIPVIFRTLHEKAALGKKPEQRELALKNAGKESAAVLGFSSAMGAFGAFFIPKSFGTSMALTGGPEMAFYMFVGFYLSCIDGDLVVVTARKGAATTLLSRT